MNKIILIIILIISILNINNVIAVKFYIQKSSNFNIQNSSNGLNYVIKKILENNKDSQKIREENYNKLLKDAKNRRNKLISCRHPTNNIGIYNLSVDCNVEFTGKNAKIHHGYTNNPTITIINKNVCKNVNDFLLSNSVISQKRDYPGITWDGEDSFKGNRTSWWKGWSTACMEWGFFASSTASSLADFNKNGSFSFTIKKNSRKKYGAKLKGKANNDYISLEGTSSETFSTKTYTTPTFNSPFLYFKNSPNSKIDITINSEFNNYKTEPNFSKDNTWSGKMKDDEIIINNKKYDKLFYELEMTKIDLNRNGRNFSDKKELFDFLQNGEFFDKLGFTQKQKENSLNYLLPQIPDYPNYYLTILSQESINKTSKLNFSIKPEEFIRKYFAIYPTKTPIKTYKDIEYPNYSNSKNKFSIIETGEFLIKPNMFVFWEN